MIVIWWTIVVRSRGFSKVRCGMFEAGYVLCRGKPFRTFEDGSLLDGGFEIASHMGV